MFKIKFSRFLLTLSIFISVFSFTSKVFAYSAIPTNAHTNIPNTYFGMGENNWGPWTIYGICPLGTFNDTAHRDINFYLDDVVSEILYTSGIPICTGFWNQQFYINGFGYYENFWDKNIDFYFPEADSALPHTFSVKFSEVESSEELFVSWDLNGGYGAPIPSCSDGIQNQDETEVDTGGICQDFSSFYSDTSEQIESSFNHIIQTLGTNLTGTLTRIDIKTSNSSALFYGSRPELSLYECDDDTYGDVILGNSNCNLLYSGLSIDSSQLKKSTQSFYIDPIVFNPLKYYFFTTQGNNIFNVLLTYYGSTENTVDGACYQYRLGASISISPCIIVSDLYFRLYGISKSVIPPPPPPIGCVTDCFSSVLFLPGLMGSRLYEEGLNCGPGITDNECGDKKLWISASDSLQEKLSLNTQGKSINDIYTKNDTQKLGGDGDETGIIDEIASLNIYKSFINDLKDWKDDEIITDYAFIPYDWRLSLDDIITNGATTTDNNLSYNNTQNFSESFILKKLETLQSNSKSGKVTIIAHSNGGLVAKALMQKLKDTNNPLYDKIDKIILVAVPQVGTPDAVAALLHGTELGYGFIMDKDRSRQLSENMSTVYNFLPSASYFTTVDPGFAVDKIISFEDQPFFNPQTSEYGLFVSNETELKNYVLGTDSRSKPSFGDTVHPNIGNSNLYTQAESVHQILDVWSPSPDTKVIQVAGWGEETIAGLDYKTYRDKDLFETLSYKPRMVVDGDGTVVVPSALWMSDSDPNVERWWVDLKKFNKNNLPDRVHRSILEVSNLRTFIKSQIKDSVVTDSEDIIVDNTSTLTSDDSRLHFTLHSPLSLGITDSQGNYTGMDPATKEIKEEIPDITYKQIGEVQFISAPVGTAYTLKLQGYAEGSFSLDIEKQTGNTITNSTLFEGISSSISTLATIDINSSFEVSTAELKIDKDGDGKIDQVYPIVNVETPITNSTPSDSNASGSSGGGGSLPIPVQVVYQSTIEDKSHVQSVQQIKETQEESKKLDTVEALKNVIQEPKIEQQEEETGTKVLEYTKQTENIPLSASVINSELSGNWILYVIILTMLILIFLIKRFIKV